ncbi:nucleotidyltransferase substrate binding protein [Terrimonas pollutisoli]|uniref:nucleotidyltransferase substrate binding protein n=1 Tax=Terrimonas pollutisoli TaxID=3034147 RepID=UPI0023ECB5EE|nr:nucleotidyltransferase substrate binding protein [Terrimonas sp. H1YJ31]
MPPNRDIRWIQRFNNYKKALARLNEAADIGLFDMNDLEMNGLIQRFEFTFELAWKTLRDLMRYNGNSLPEVVATVIEAAIEEGWITDAENWRRMRVSRNKTSHTYDEQTANEIATDTIEVFLPLFIQLETRLEVERLS